MTIRRFRSLTFALMLFAAVGAFSTQTAQATMSAGWTDCNDNMNGYPWNQVGCESNAVGTTGCVGEAPSGSCIDGYAFCSSQCAFVEHYSCGDEPLDPEEGVGFVCRCGGCEYVE